MIQIYKYIETKLMVVFKIFSEPCHCYIQFLEIYLMKLVSAQICRLMVVFRAELCYLERLLRQQTATAN